MYTAILMSEPELGFELANHQVDDLSPIRYSVLIPSSEFDGHRHPSRPETMVRKDVIFYLDAIETELAQMLYGGHVVVYTTRKPHEIYMDHQTEGPF
jgi:hypothetical protein